MHAQFGEAVIQWERRLTKGSDSQWEEVYQSFHLHGYHARAALALLLEHVEIISWSYSVMPRNQFKALLAFLRVSDPKRQLLCPIALHSLTAEALPLTRSIFPTWSEPLTRESKGRSGIGQCMRAEVINWGYEWWVLVDCKSGYAVHSSA